MAKAKDDYALWFSFFAASSLFLTLSSSSFLFYEVYTRARTFALVFVASLVLLALKLVRCLWSFSFYFIRSSYSFMCVFCMRCLDFLAVVARC